MHRHSDASAEVTHLRQCAHGGSTHPFGMLPISLRWVFLSALARACSGGCGFARCFCRGGGCVPQALTATAGTCLPSATARTKPRGAMSAHDDARALRTPRLLGKREREEGEGEVREPITVSSQRSLPRACRHRGPSASCAPARDARPEACRVTCVYISVGGGRLCVPERQAHVAAPHHRRAHLGVAARI